MKGGDALVKVSNENKSSLAINVTDINGNEISYSDKNGEYKGDIHQLLDIIPVPFSLKIAASVKEDTDVEIDRID